MNDKVFVDWAEGVLTLRREERVRKRGRRKRRDVPKRSKGVVVLVVMSGG